MASRASTNLDHENEENCILKDDLVKKIIQNVPINEWSQWEIVSKQFQRCVQNAYRALKTLDLKTVFLAEFGKYLKNGNENVFKLFFTKLIHHCPLLEAISGFDCLLDDIGSDHFDLLCQLTELKNVNFETVTMEINDLSHFLNKFPQLHSLTLNSYFDTRTKNDADFDFFKNFYGLTDLTLPGLTTCTGSFLSLINADNLKVLDFLRSEFNAPYMEDLLRRCVNLETLRLTDRGTCDTCSTTGFELKVFQCLPNLTKLRTFELEISHTMIKFDFCGDEAEVRHLHQGNQPITYNSDVLLNVLVKCKSLRDIRLRCIADNKIFTDNFLQHLCAECPHLEVLEFNLLHCHSEEIVSNIEYLENLTRLQLEDGDNTILKRLCSNLYKLNRLSHLILWNNVTEAELVLLKDLKNLTHFTTRATVTETVLKKWIEIGFLKKITVLNIRADVADEIVKSICENTPNLTDFWVNTTDISDETFLVFSEHCKSLQTLDITECSKLTEKGLLSLLVVCPSLRCVKINSQFYDIILSNVSFQPFKHVIMCDF